MGTPSLGTRRKERLELRVELPSLVLQGLPNLLAGLVMIYADRGRVVCGPVVRPGDAGTVARA